MWSQPEWSQPDGFFGQLSAALSGASGALSAADRLCEACVELLGVDGASVSLVYESESRGTFGSSGAMSRRLDELQFTLGEGPCLDAVATGTEVLLYDLDDPAERRWPVYRTAALEADIGAIFVLPVKVAATPVGALDLFRRRTGPLTDEALTGARIAADLAAVPLLNILSGDVDLASVEQGAPWPQIATLERVEVNQATGMIIAALDVNPVEALLRLRAYSFAQGQTASETAYHIINGRLSADLPD